MININNKTQTTLSNLGNRLREARLARNESQETFAARIGLSRQSYSKMEKGSPTIAIGHWLAASDILNRLASWDNVLAEQQNLFEQFERQKSKRQRAGRKRTGHQ